MTRCCRRAFSHAAVFRQVVYADAGLFRAAAAHAAAAAIADCLRLRYYIEALLCARCRCH